MDVWRKQVAVLDKNKTETEEFKLKGMLEYHFDDKLICKTGIYMYLWESILSPSFVTE